MTSDEKKRYSRVYRQKNREKINARMRLNSSLPGRRWNDYKKNAKYWGHEFTITKEEFMFFWQKPCHWCGYQIKTIGLDRVNPSLGYTIRNVVACCAICNRAKSDLTVPQWVALCSNVVRKHGLTYARV